jgi:predicted regulator of Ras-like GTPase activity (Roadblock/LC7/MglB family)
VNQTISEDRSVSSTAIPELRYRYHEVAPESISVPVSELLKRLPPECLGDGDPGKRSVDLPCGELLGGNTPRLPLGLLHDLLPDFVRLPEGRDRGERISLPGGWLALHFRLKSERVALSAETTSEDVETDREEAEPVVERVKEQEDARESSVHISLDRESDDLPSLEEISIGPRREHLIVDVVSTPVLDDRPTLRGTPNRKRPPRHGIFASLPIFKRRAPEEVTPSAKFAAGKEDASVELALEPLWKLAPQDRLADPDALQALFMTDEKLTLDRVIALAGDLPGLRACVLAHGEKVICTSKTPAGIDLQTLSSQAMTMLSQIRDSSANLGLGAVPAVTLHAEHGALSFLHNGELCLLVLHGDRGFVPGVRERLQDMLTHLSSAKALPAGPETPAGIEPPKP